MKTQTESQAQVPNLAKLILADLFTVGRMALLLLLAIFATSMAIVFTTHQTRQAITASDKVSVDREHLDAQWRNLILEETTLSEHSRVEEIATKSLDMKRPDADKEVVIPSHD